LGISDRLDSISTPRFDGLTHNSHLGSTFTHMTKDTALDSSGLNPEGAQQLNANN
jgi:hypothetical protein